MSKDKPSWQARLTELLWHSLKLTQAEAPKKLAPSVRSFGALLEAIGQGDDELLYLWRKCMKEAIKAAARR